MTLERVYVAEQVVSMLRECAEHARPLETGGILVGVLRDGEPWITSALEVIDHGRTSARFVIPFGITPMAVEAAREHDGRMGYVGDWHSHPADISASPTDRATLRRNARRARRQKNVPTILLVVRNTEAGWCVDALGDIGSGPAPVEIVLTGQCRPPRM